MRPGYILGCDRSDVTNVCGSDTGWSTASTLRGQGSRLGVPGKGNRSSWKSLRRIDSHLGWALRMVVISCGQGWWRRWFLGKGKILTLSTREGSWQHEEVLGSPESMGWEEGQELGASGGGIR